MEVALSPGSWEDGVCLPDCLVDVDGGYRRRGLVGCFHALPTFHPWRSGCFPGVCCPCLCQGGYGGNMDDKSITRGRSSFVGRQILEDAEIRELLIDCVGHRYCWGSRPARTWKISTIEDCNVYFGTLETFVEEREVVRKTEPYAGGRIDGKESGPELGVWELDLRSEFPLLFLPYQESRIKIPHSEVVEKCSVCHGRGKIVCETCNPGQEPGFYKENQMTPFSLCNGRGLIAHKDGSDTICGTCQGKGKLYCGTCGSSGLLACEMCDGEGSLLIRDIALVKWLVLLQGQHQYQIRFSTEPKASSYEIHRLTSAHLPSLPIHSSLTSFRQM